MQIVVVKLANTSLASVDGCLKLIKFVDFVKAYGEGTFRQTIEAALPDSLLQTT